MAEDAEHWKREAMEAQEAMAAQEDTLAELELANAELDEEKMEVPVWPVLPSLACKSSCHL